MHKKVLPAVCDGMVTEKRAAGAWHPLSVRFSPVFEPFRRARARMNRETVSASPRVEPNQRNEASGHTSTRRREFESAAFWIGRAVHCNFILAAALGHLPLPGSAVVTSTCGPPSRQPTSTPPSPQNGREVGLQAAPVSRERQADSSVLPRDRRGGGGEMPQVANWPKDARPHNRS